jgi:hypothetical protein
MYLRRWFPLMILAFLVAGCTGIVCAPPMGDLPTGNPPVPEVGDEPMARTEAHIDSLAIVSDGSFPPVYQLQVKGSLPTPCDHLRTTANPPSADSEIYVQVYAVVDPYEVCSQVLQPFEVSVPLGSYVRGSYAVIVNGKNVGQITP